jgi:NAD-dependent dihydropyrimidine dehydrogenase PreA subunit
MRTQLLLVSALLVACSSHSDSPAPTADAGTPDADSAAEPDGGPENTLTMSIQLAVPPATELHRCQFVELPSDKDVEAVAMSHVYTAGSHHFLLFQTDLDAIPPDLAGQYDCVNGDEPIMLHTHGVLYGGQSPTGAVSLPPGVGLGLKAHQVLMMQAHYINTTSDVIDSTVSMTFTTGPADAIETQAGFLVFYDPFIDLPPQSPASSSIRCNVPEDVTIVMASTHYHQRGTSMSVWNDPAPSALATEPFYTTHDWQHAMNFVGPMNLAQGSVVRFRCDYLNTDTLEVFQGPNATTSEMCVFGAVYYPKRDDDFAYCDHLSVVGSSTDSCAALASCVQTCPGEDAPHRTPGGVNVGPCWERCVARGCDGAPDALLDLTACIGAMCQEECAAGGDACAACAAAKCTPAYLACAAQTCP